MASRVVLHVGLTKTGTTYLQRLLAEAAEPLRAAGVLVADVGPGSAFRGAVDVRGSRARFGLPADRVDGVWAALGDLVRAQDGPALLGHEVLAGASPAQVTRALEALRGQPVRVVVTARDLGRQAVAHWQEQVKLGDTRSFARFSEQELESDSGPDDGPDAGGVRPHFWHAQDFADTLRRWTAAPPGLLVEGSLVVVPGPGTSPVELWQRYAAAAGLDPAVTAAVAATPAATAASNVSLGREEIALLRAVNARLPGDLDTATRLRVVKREWAEGELARRGGEPPRTPAGMAPLLAAATDRMVERVREHGWAVHGDLADLEPVVGGEHHPPPDASIPRGSHPRRIARRLARGGGGGH